jgi:outer membrane protein
MLKKLFKVGIVLSVLLSADASADFLRLEMGAGAWNYTPSGTMSYTDDSGVVSGTYTSSENKSSDAYIWVLLKHPLPIVPNLRLEYCDVKDEGIVTGAFKEFSVPASVAYTSARYEMKQYDIIPYYNLLDNTFWTTVDIGIDIKIVDATYEADNVYVAGVSVPTHYTDSEVFALPLVYARTRVEIPATGFGIEADGKYITYDGSTVYDLRAKIDYSFDFKLFDPGLEVGYRVQKFDFKTDDDKTKVNVDFAGFYAGLMVRF